ncbi:MAG: penicillin-binding transpeptidase domain-containing protein, partial [Corynebacterium sp.]|nr:penicillin-binding transpeptidase domain-containing protein [Corynebacterium sp.]
HGTEPYTTTGIFGKSSNVGTLMIADKLGQEKYAEYLKKFGLGNTTGIELPNESAGSVPDLEQWSGGTFANLPIGQGQSWTTLQMASVYQALANGGERIEPRIIDSVKGPDGKDEKLEEPEKNQVVSPETAKTTVDMFRAVFQDDDAGLQNGTAGNAQLKGYQLSGKTGTAQKVDPNTWAYSNSAYRITFAGIAPADDPRFVVAVMLDEPKSGVEDNGGGGQSAAPIFRDIASWLLNRDNIPTSKPAPRLTLRAQ